MSVYGQFCPVARATELLGERWTFLVIRELLAGSRQFNDIHRGIPKMSRTLLSRRLRRLIDAGLIDRRTQGGRIRYELSQAGLELEPVIELLGHWGDRWLDAPDPAEALDPGLLIWELKRSSAGRPLADRPVQVRFDLTDYPEFRRSVWTVDDEGRIEIQDAHATSEADLRVRASTHDLARVWLRRESLEDAVDSGRVRLRGDPDLASRFSDWLGGCRYASTPH